MGEEFEIQGIDPELLPDYKEYQNYLKQPYFKTHNPISYEDWIEQRTKNPGTIIDLGGEPDTGPTLNEKAKYYWDPIKGAAQRHEAAMRNGTHVYHGFNRTIVPAVQGALLLSGITSIPTLWKSGKSLLNIARTTPHGMRNLGLNLGIQTIVPLAGSYLGNKVDKYLGGTGSLGGTLFGIGSSIGLNKIPLMKNFNYAISNPYNSNNDIPSSTFWGKEKPIRVFADDKGNTFPIPEDTKILPGGYIDKGILHATYTKDLTGALYKYENNPAYEIHIGGEAGGVTKSGALEIMKMMKSLPKGSYITPDGTATTQAQRIAHNGILHELFNKTPQTQLFNPPTVDGYTTILKFANKSKNPIHWADNTYLTRFHNPMKAESFATQNTTLQNAYSNYINNPSDKTLELLNQELIKIGGKPASVVGGELRIPFPLMHLIK